ncbi:MAG: beta-lactamase family protein [Chitinophagaceae bacterium]|nr:beta-lactamase family protein [Chitinophagaceae bacterium]
MLLAIFSFLLFSCTNPNFSDAVLPSSDSTINYKPLTENAKEYYQQQIENTYSKLLANTGFSGGIIVAKNGEVLFEDYRGYANYTKKEPFTKNTSVHIASVSKTFTAIAVLQLMEKGLVDLDADVRNYLPHFPYKNITVKNLLSHRSGLPNYVHLMDGKKVILTRKKNKRGKWVTYKKVVANNWGSGLVTNQKVLDFFVERKPAIEALPNRKFNYCNTNFALLALIIEKASGQSYPTYIQENIFIPLGMSNSYVFSINDTARYTPSYKYNNVAYGIEKLDCVYGDKNIYSTPEDLLLWDQALYSEKLLKKENLQLAFTPYSFERPGNNNYGLGFRLYTYPDKTIPYHNGWWHGNNAVFTRLVQDSATIIVLGNKFNSKIYKAKEMASIFTTSPESFQEEEQ